MIETRLVAGAMKTIESFLASNVRNQIISQSESLIHKLVRDASAEDIKKAISMIDTRVSAKRFEAEVSKVIERKMSSEIKKLIRNIELPAEPYRKQSKPHCFLKSQRKNMTPHELTSKELELIRKYSSILTTMCHRPSAPAGGETRPPAKIRVTTRCASATSWR